MKLASGTIISLAFICGALLVFIAVISSNGIIDGGRRPPKTSFLRSSFSTSSSRKLYNWSNSNSNYNANNNYNSNSAYGGGYGGDYGGGYGGDYGANDAGYGGMYGNNYGDQQSAYGNNYANYNANDYNNYQNYQNQNYDNSNYIWQRDDDDNYKNDDASYYNQNSNYRADGSNYNGRGETWGGQSVQAYTDDEVPVVYEEGQDEDDEEWNVFGKISGLTARETVAISVLAVIVSLSMLLLMLLAFGCNIIDFVGIYCCCGIFGHKDQSSSPTETIEDGFVKLGDY